KESIEWVESRMDSAVCAIRVATRIGNPDCGENQMADRAEVRMKSTLGLTGLTMNAMALIAPGAFLWLTFNIQSVTGSTAPSMWIGIVVALVLCLATAICYAEMA